MSLVRRCCVPGCKGSGGEKKIPLHRFPHPELDKKRFNTWLYSIGGEIIGLDNGYIFKHCRVCRKHFRVKFLCRNNRLSNIALPTLYMPAIMDAQDRDSDTSMAECTEIVTEPTEQQELLLHEEAEPQQSSDPDDALEIEQVAQLMQAQPVVMSMTQEKPKRLQPQQTTINCECSKAIFTMSAGIAEFNTKRKDLDDIKRNLLKEELEFKRKLFEVQLQTAKKELEIKTEILRQVKDGKISSYLLGAPQPSLNVKN